MTVERRAAAPRLIQWTGERCVPWTHDIQVLYEHYHRYLWAAQLVRGRRVLDLGSGEGFGSAILADVADAVYGIDVDPTTVKHSKLNYAARNLEFTIGSALDLSSFEPGSIGAVVCFEMIEHVTAHEQMIEQIDRVLAGDGLFIASTPDRRMYSEATGQRNPFHARELTEEEFRALLAAHFEHLGLWGQRTLTGSRIASLDAVGAPRPLSVFLERTGDTWRQAGDPAPMYLIAVASHAPYEPPPTDSTLADHGLELVRQSECAASEAAERNAKAARQELHDAHIAAAASEAAHQHEREHLTHQLIERTRELDQAREEASRAGAEVAIAHSRLAEVEESVSWSLLQRARGTLYAIVGERSLIGRAIQASLRGVGRITGVRQPPPAPQSRGPRVAAQDDARHRASTS